MCRGMAGDETNRIRLCYQHVALNSARSFVYILTISKAAYKTLIFFF